MTYDALPLETLIVLRDEKIVRYEELAASGESDMAYHLGIQINAIHDAIDLAEGNIPICHDDAPYDPMQDVNYVGHPIHY